MTSPSTVIPATIPVLRRPALADAAPVLLLLVSFAVLFATPFKTLALDWWNDPDAGHGLLLAPLSLWLAWRSGVDWRARPAPITGTIVIAAAVLLRYVAGLAVEFLTLRGSMVMAAVGIILFFRGYAQVRRWWLPILLFCLSIPLPDVLTNSLALPLQFKASRMGAALLEFRHVPVHLSGNVIDLPGRRLFVTEACSGLRSLTALLSLGVLVGGLWLRHPMSRVLLIAAAIPVAIVINAFRVFLTGFLVYFVSPEMGEGFMHMSEGWLMFVIAFGVLGGLTWLVASFENRWLKGGTNA